jgi:methyl-accepting chemotaxis protein
MTYFNNMKIGTKLSLGFGTLLILMLVLATISIKGMSSVDRAMEKADAKQIEKLNPLYEAREALDQTGLAARNAYLFRDERDAQKELTILDEQRAIYLAALKKMQPAFAGNREFDKVNIGLQKMAEELKRPRQYREAGKLQEYSEFLVNECSPLRRQIVIDIDLLLTSVKQESDSERDAVGDLLAHSMQVIVILAVAVLLFCVVVAVLITRSLLKQLGGEPAYAAAIADKIANGELSVDVQTKPGDETSLLFAIRTMRDKLASIVTQVRVGTNHIENASTEISSGNNDLSSRTEQQASALGETATAMEQLTATVKQNADNARQASQLAASASDVATQGGAVVSQVIDTIGAINESSKRIVDIISVIDGIAFQTNILALNAAVEAARAGEQGRGFAVVASEVRGLAQRSASAAKEIKELIDDSVNKVHTGSQLVEQAGATMAEVVSSVKRVTDVVSEISSASQEQSDGIGQVNLAITQMEETTQRNAALVEESTAAASALLQESSNLSAVIATFKLNGDTPGQQSVDVAPAPRRSSRTVSMPQGRTSRIAALRRV